MLLLVWAKFEKIKQCCVSALAVSNYHLKNTNGKKKHPIIKYKYLTRYM